VGTSRRAARGQKTQKELTMRKRSIWERDVYGRGWYERLQIWLTEWAAKVIDFVMNMPLLVLMAIGIIVFGLVAIICAPICEAIKKAQDKGKY